MHLATSPSFCSLQVEVGCTGLGASSAVLRSSETGRTSALGGYTCRLQVCTGGQLVLNRSRLKRFGLETLALV